MTDQLISTNRFTRMTPIKPLVERIYFIVCKDRAWTRLTWEMCQARQVRGHCEGDCPYTDLPKRKKNVKNKKMELIPEMFIKSDAARYEEDQKEEE